MPVLAKASKHRRDPCHIPHSSCVSSATLQQFCLENTASSSEQAATILRAVEMSSATVSSSLEPASTVTATPQFFLVTQTSTATTQITTISDRATTLHTTVVSKETITSRVSAISSFNSEYYFAGSNRYRAFATNAVPGPILVAICFVLLLLGLTVWLAITLCWLYRSHVELEKFVKWQETHPQAERDENSRSEEGYSQSRTKPQWSQSTSQLSHEQISKDDKKKGDGYIWPLVWNKFYHKVGVVQLRDDGRGRGRSAESKSSSKRSRSYSESSGQQNFSRPGRHLRRKEYPAEHELYEAHHSWRTHPDQQPCGAPSHYEQNQRGANGRMDGVNAQYDPNLPQRKRRQAADGRNAVMVDESSDQGRRIMQAQQPGLGFEFDNSGPGRAF